MCKISRGHDKYFLAREIHIHISQPLLVRNRSLLTWNTFRIKIAKPPKDFIFMKQSIWSNLFQNFRQNCERGQTLDNCRNSVGKRKMETLLPDQSKLFWLLINFQFSLVYEFPSHFHLLQWGDSCLTALFQRIFCRV